MTPVTNSITQIMKQDRIWWPSCCVHCRNKLLICSVSNESWLYFSGYVNSQEYHILACKFHDNPPSTLKLCYGRCGVLSAVRISDPIYFLYNISTSICSIYSDIFSKHLFNYTRICALLTHWGRVTRILVFYISTMQTCNENLRF